MFMKDTGLYFPFLMPSLSGFSVRIMLAEALNEKFFLLTYFLEEIV